MDKEVEDKFLFFEKVLLTLNKDLQISAAKADSVNDGLKKIKKDIESIEIIAREMQTDSSGGGVSSGGAGISDAQVEVAIKKILLEDPELLETFKKIIENVVSFNQDKELMNSYIESKNKKKKKSKIPLVSIIAGLIVLLFGIGFYFFNPNTTSIILKSGQVFYDSKKNAQYPLNKDIELSVSNEDDERYYFKLNNKEYFILKKQQQ